MDGAQSLISELLQKLAELDHKVNVYRLDIAAEYQRFSTQLLQNVPPDVCAEVSRAVAESMQNFPAIGPALESRGCESDANSTSDRRVWDGKGSPPPVLPHTSGVPPNQGLFPPSGTDSPQMHSPQHERESEFYGLFTPTYLPLLDDGDRYRATSPPAAPEPPHDSVVTSVAEAEPSKPDAPANPAPAPSSLVVRPDPVRRSTEETLSSITSDDSTATRRRSALRRSSSSSIKTQSPRRVRFDVEGEEVLPTSSPPTSPRAADLPLSPLGNSDSSLVDDSYEDPIVTEEDPDVGLLGSSPPGPKKVSSTERLKALARSSTEDTSKWTVVGDTMGLAADQDDDDLVMAGPKGKKAEAFAQTTVTAESRPGDIEEESAEDETPRASRHASEEEEVDDEDDEDDEGRDEMLMMPKLSSFKGKKRFSPAEIPAASSSQQTNNIEKPNGHKTPAASTSKHEPLDDEDLFSFDDEEESEGVRKEPRPSSKYIDEDEHRDDEEEEEAAEEPQKPTGRVGAGAGKSARAMAQLGTSPAVPIAKRAEPPTSPTAARFNASSSVGSYQGRPISFNVVNDPELLRKAAELGQFQTFVGSVDGRSGVDESSSYRQSLRGVFSGRPRSFSERLAQEEADGEDEEPAPEPAPGRKR